MNDILLGEVRFFVNSILWGVLLVVFYDVFRIFRRVVKHNYLTTLIEDLIYWITNGVLIFRMMYQHNDGIIRVYTIIGIVIGMVIYHNSLSDSLVEYISGCINQIISYIKKVIGIIINGLLWPFRWIYKRIKGVTLFLCKKLFLFVKKPLKKILVPIINSLNKCKKRFTIRLSIKSGNVGTNKEDIDNEKEEN